MKKPLKILTAILAFIALWILADLFLSISPTLFVLQILFDLFSNPHQQP